MRIRCDECRARVTCVMLVMSLGVLTLDVVLVLIGRQPESSIVGVLLFMAALTAVTRFLASGRTYTVADGRLVHAWFSWTRYRIDLRSTIVEVSPTRIRVGRRVISWLPPDSRAKELLVRGLSRELQREQ